MSIYEINDDVFTVQHAGISSKGIGDDTYILAPATISANADITISDTQGSNKIQLIEGLEISSTKITADAIQLTTSNNTTITILGAAEFDYTVGGNPHTGSAGQEYSFSEFLNAFGEASPTSGVIEGNGFSVTDQNSLATTETNTPIDSDDDQSDDQTSTDDSQALFTPTSNIALPYTLVAQGLFNIEQPNEKALVITGSDENNFAIDYFRATNSTIYDIQSTLHVIADANNGKDTVYAYQLIYDDVTNESSSSSYGFYQLDFEEKAWKPLSDNDRYLNYDPIYNSTQTEDGFIIAMQPNAYGQELFKATFNNQGKLEYQLIKDINPGVENGVSILNSFFYNEPSVYDDNRFLVDSADFKPSSLPLLSNGTFIFTANDGTDERYQRGDAWVSNGTAEGTFELIPYAMATWATVYQDHFILRGNTFDNNIHVSDGTLEGTRTLNTHFDVYQISTLGEYNEELFFASESEDSISIYKLTNVNADDLEFVTNINAPLSINNNMIGFDGEKILWSYDDGIHGHELWATNLSTGDDFYLVKDIIEGTGAGVSDDYINTLNDLPLEDDLFVFKANSVEWDSEWFISDGTSSGTYSLGLIDTPHSQIFADEDTHNVSAINANSELVSLSSLAPIVILEDIERYESNSHYIIALTESNELYSYDLATKSIEHMMTDVADFKVFNDEAIYITQGAEYLPYFYGSENNNQSLWFTDGTAGSLLELGQVNGTLNLDNSVIMPNDNWLLS